MAEYGIREASEADRPLLVDMLVEAVNWPAGRDLPHDAVLADSTLMHYVAGWPRSGELGTVAEARGMSVGASWLRFFTSDDPGFGYVADDVPELSMAVVAEWRGRGIGRTLLCRTAELAQRSGIARISLSVERGNFAHDLYAQEGYEVVYRGSDADTMVLEL